MPRLPDFCNIGVWLRVLLAVNAGMVLLAFDASVGSNPFLQNLIERAALVEPTAIASLLGLRALHPLLARTRPLPAALLVLLTCGAVAVACAFVFDPGHAVGMAWRPLFWSLLAATLLLVGFDLSARAHEPALAQARLLALTARIRPHFFFNSLNAVLGVMRRDPRRAETALEELADLFRALMRDNRELVPLSAELALARQYLELERLRLGDRLLVRWEIERCPPDALVLPLMLQPLLENAVYHGIEPGEGPGEILVRIASTSAEVTIEIENPTTTAATHHEGNHMALDNIRERLLLFFDLEARLDSLQRDGRHSVRIVFPYRTSGG